LKCEKVYNLLLNLNYGYITLCVFNLSFCRLTTTVHNSFAPQTIDYTIHNAFSDYLTVYRKWRQRCSNSVIRRNYLIIPRLSQL